MARPKKDYKLCQLSIEINVYNMLIEHKKETGESLTAVLERLARKEFGGGEEVTAVTSSLNEAKTMV